MWRNSAGGVYALRVDLAKEGLDTVCPHTGGVTLNDTWYTVERRNIRITL